MIEKIIFNLVAIVLFILIFAIMIKRNDTNYISILIISAVGIFINFIGLSFGFYNNWIVKIIEYLLAVVIPLIIIILEKNNIKYSEIIVITKLKYWMFSKQQKKAKKGLIALVTKYPHSYIGRKALAELYEKEEDYENAMIEYYRVYDLKNDDFNSNVKIAEMQMKLGKSQDAEETLNDLLERKPECYIASNLLGDILYEQERYKEAINIYTEALKYKPEDYNLYYNLGMIYIRLNDFQNAKTCYDKAAEINSKKYNAYYTLGQLSLIANDLEAAEKYFIESLYDETEADSYFELSKIYMFKGDREKAILFIQKAIDLDVKYVKLAKREPIFIPIKMHIKEPEVEKTIESNLTNKELEIREKLIETLHIVEKIGYRQREETLEKNMKNKSDKDIEDEI